MTAISTTPGLSGLPRRLVREELITVEAAMVAVAKAGQQRMSVYRYLAESNTIDSSRLAHVAADEFGLPMVDLRAVDMEQAPLADVSEKLIRKHHVLPLFKRGRRLFVAVADPINLAALDEIKFHTHAVVEPILADFQALQKAIDSALEQADTSLEDLDDADLENLDIAEESDPAEDDKPGDGADDAPVVRFVNKVLLDAIKRGASDIHFEPYEKTYRVRYRLDGILHEVAAPPATLGPRLSARLKVMSRLDIAERRVPQDGRIKMNLSKTRSIDFRVNTCPTLFGEKIVLRILDSSAASLDIDLLGYEPEQKKLYTDMLAKPHGLILVTGPTGSGKTVSLYSGLKLLNTADRNICTAEDPAEINLPGINQVNVNQKVGLTFAAALKAFLRQDPDVVMVGEIRDLETAEIAIKAAQTGHLVLSTLHTNDAPQTLNRLAQMGVASFNIATAISLIIAQRLARRLCNHCRKPMADVPMDIFLDNGFSAAEVQASTVYENEGCEQCTDGYKGRVGIYQVMPVSEDMGRLILAGGNAMQIGEQADKEQIDNLRRSGLRKALQGVTSLTEVNRVTSNG